MLEAVDDSEEAVTLIQTAVPIEVAGRLSRLREQLRTDHLNDEERVSLVKICEEYNDIFHLSGDTLTCTSAAEHAITTRTIDQSRALTLNRTETTEIQYTYDNYVKELQAHLQSSYEIARSNLQAKKEKSKEYHDRTVNMPLFVVGDKVLLHDETVRRRRS
jgi:hypothetical protein